MTLKLWLPLMNKKNINLKAAEFQSSENELSKVKSLEDTSTVLTAPDAK